MIVLSSRVLCVVLLENKGVGTRVCQSFCQVGVQLQVKVILFPGSGVASYYRKKL